MSFFVSSCQIGDKIVLLTDMLIIDVLIYHLMGDSKFRIICR